MQIKKGIFCFIYQKLDFKQHSFLLALQNEDKQIVMHSTILQDQKY